jgi:competence protein ComEC
MPGGSLRVTARTDFSKACVHHPDRQDVYHRPLILMSIALAVGILVGGTWPGYLLQAIAVGCLTTARIVYAWIRNRRTRITPIILFCILGYSLISPWLPADFSKQHISHYMDSHRWQIEGEVTRILPVRHGRTRFILRVAQLQDDNRAFAVVGHIRVTVSGERPEIVPGMRLTFQSRIRSFRNFNNPGGFDYRRHMAFQQVFGSAFVVTDRLRLVAGTTTPGESLIAKYRGRARAVIEQLSDTHAQAIMKALLIGDRQTISPGLRRMFNRCGVGHLLAISGLHIGIVGGLVFWIFHWALNWFAPVLERGWGRRGATLMSVGPILFYAILSGLSPATQRALIMVMAFMATYFVHKDGDTLNFLALAALLMLIVYPPALFSISFQLSFAAVFWIILGLSVNDVGRPLRSNWRDRLVNRIKIFVLVTFWATLGTLPLVMRYFQEVSLIGLIANCLLVPMIGVFVLPVGLLSLFMLPVNGELASLGIQMAGGGLSQALKVLQMLAAFDGAAIETFVPTSLEIACYYGLWGLILMRRVVKPARWMFFCVLAVLVVDGLYWGYERFWHSDLRVTVIDVGQGSASLIQFPG